MTPRRYQWRALVLGALLAGLAAVHPAGARAGSPVRLDGTKYAGSLAGLHAPVIVAGGGDNNQGDNNQGDNNQGDNNQGDNNQGDQHYNGSGSGTATPELGSDALTAIGMGAAVVLLVYRRRLGSALRTGK
jgi:hypothetical protein